MTSFVVAMKKAFCKPGQTLPEFNAELKALTPEDRTWYATQLGLTGVEIDPSTVLPAAAKAA